MSCDNKDKSAIMIGGSREYADREQVELLIKKLKHNSIILHGNCPDSPDVWAAEQARKMGMTVGDFSYVKSLGKMGGHIRNRAMVELADVCIFFWDGSSRGTGETIKYAKQQNKLMYVFTPGESIEGLFPKGTPSIKY